MKIYNNKILMIIKFWFTFEILIHLNNLENSRTITTINHILNSYDKRERERREGEGEMLLKNASKSKLSNTCIIMLNIPSSSDFILSFAFSETYCNYRFGSKHSQIFLFCSSFAATLSGATAIDGPMIQSWIAEQP